MAARKRRRVKKPAIRKLKGGALSDWIPKINGIGDIIEPILRPKEAFMRHTTNVLGNQAWNYAKNHTKEIKNAFKTAAHKTGKVLKYLPGKAVSYAKKKYYNNIKGIPYIGESNSIMDSTSNGQPIFNIKTRNRFFKKTVPKIKTFKQEESNTLNQRIPTPAESTNDLEHFPQIKSSNRNKPNAPVEIMVNYQNYLKNKKVKPEYHTLIKSSEIPQPAQQPISTVATKPNPIKKSLAENYLNYLS